jgi:hypothetical protein
MHEINRMFDMIDSQQNGFVTFDKLKETISSPNFAAMMESVRKQGKQYSDGDASRQEEAEAEGIDVEEDEGPAGDEENVSAPFDPRLPTISRKAIQWPPPQAAVLLPAIKGSDKRSLGTGTGMVIGKSGMSGPQEQKPDAPTTSQRGVIHFRGPKSRAIARMYRDRARNTLEKGAMWEFKTFVLFPICSQVRHLDIMFRAIFPVAYGIFVYVHMAEVNFGQDQYELLSTTPCYQAATKQS